MNCSVGNHPPISECAKCKKQCPFEVEDFSKWDVRMGEDAIRS
ncbi:MAG: hypothetical protein PHI12_08655 [Dehalococcoidales bacterium]|nr:hypothetical protein [Dehalococcoidales bacterium]